MDAGFVEIVYGGAEQGRYLCHHATVESIHLTGSAATFNAIVWGDNNAKVRPRRRVTALRCADRVLRLEGATTRQPRAH